MQPVLSPLLTVQPVLSPLLTEQPVLSPLLTVQPNLSLFTTDNAENTLPSTDYAASTPYVVSDDIPSLHSACSRSWSGANVTNTPIFPFLYVDIIISQFTVLRVNMWEYIHSQQMSGDNIINHKIIITWCRNVGGGESQRVWPQLYVD